MAAKKQVVNKETNQISDVVETGVAPVMETKVYVDEKSFETVRREPGTVIKTYVQNGLGYKRVVQDDGISTLDIRA
jgi:hypothetical protein